MKKFILSTFVIISFGLYVILQNTSNSSSNLIISTPIVSTTNTKKGIKDIQNNQQPTVVYTPITVSTPKPTAPVVVPKKTGIYNDGEYIGSSVDAYYGNVQVKAIISGGKLVDVQFLDYPQDARNSVRINSRAMPILRQEAITAQSANVNGVSGASETSPAFIQSLTDALNQAKA